MMEEQAIIRLIHEEELFQLLDLYEHFEHDDLKLEDSQELRELWKDICHDPSLFYIVAETEGRLAASCNISIIKNLTRCARPFGLIENVITHREYRNRGLGKSVLAKAVEIAREKNCYKVMLLTGSKKVETLRFYENAGFVKGVKTGFIMKL